jgi:MFS family permease
VSTTPSPPSDAPYDPSPPRGAEGVGYGALIRGNRNFRLLWLGTVISLFGDWFNTIALYTLVTVLTGSPLAVGLVEALKLSGFALASIPAGLLADRLDRRRLMIAADLLRAAIVPLFLFIDTTAELPLLYLLIAAQVGLGAIFDPAFRALTPNLVRADELLTANTILSATWSTLLAVGASLGGIAAAGLGLEAVFIIDAATYLISAACIWAIRPPPAARRAARPAAARKTALLVQAAHIARTDLVEAASWLLRHPRLLRLALAKTAWAFGGAALVYLLTQLGPRLTPTDAALGIGFLYAARGLGTGIGPILTRALFLDTRRWPLVCALSIAVSGLGYLVVGALGATFGVLVPIIVAHAASGSNWVLSTVILQADVPDAIRGRILSAELMVLTAVEAAVILGAAALLESGALSLEVAFFAFAGLQILSGLAYTRWVMAPEATSPGAAGR